MPGIVTSIGIILLVLAAVFYFVNIATNALIFLLIVGVILVAVGLVSGR